jgi:hypothetical protein
VATPASAKRAQAKGDQSYAQSVAEIWDQRERRERHARDRADGADEKYPARARVAGRCIARALDGDQNGIQGGQRHQRNCEQEGRGGETSRQQVVSGERPEQDGIGEARRRRGHGGDRGHEVEKGRERFRSDPAGDASARVVADGEAEKRDREDSAPDVQADPEEGRKHARRDQLQGENRRPGEEDRRTIHRRTRLARSDKKRTRGFVGRSATGIGGIVS